MPALTVLHAQPSTCACGELRASASFHLLAARRCPLTSARASQSSKPWRLWKGCRWVGGFWDGSSCCCEAQHACTPRQRPFVVAGVRAGRCRGVRSLCA